MEKCIHCGGGLKTIEDHPYHYTESGLDHVWLTGVLQYRCEKCGESSVEIPGINRLHLLIGKNIVRKKELLTGSEVRFLRKEIGMKSKDMAVALSIKPETYSRWENGKQTIAACHDKGLRMIYVMNASESLGRVLSKDSRFVLHDIAVEEAPTESERVQFTPSEWLNGLDEPIFGGQVCAG